MKLEHTAINHPDPIKAAQWYVEHLDMEIIRASTESPYIHFLTDTSKQGLLEIYNNPKAAVPDYAAMSPLILHIAFAVTDIEAARAKLLAAGATAEGEIELTTRGDHLTFVRDPWGFCIQLAQRSQSLL